MEVSWNLASTYPSGLKEIRHDLCEHCATVQQFRLDQEYSVFDNGLFSPPIRMIQNM